MLRQVLAMLVLVATLSPLGSVEAWTLWTEHEGSRQYSNRPPETSRSWERDAVFTTFEQCSDAKERIWARVLKQYGDLSRYPLIASVESIQGEAVFMDLRKRDTLIYGQLNQHFHCFPDGMDPRQ